MKNFIIAFLILVFQVLSFTGLSQQLPQYSQYLLNFYLINPAVAGTTDHYDIKAGYRKQWVGVEGSPTTFYITGNGHVGKEHERLRRRHRNQNTWHHGFGFQFIGDRTGPLSVYNFLLTYAYDMNLTRWTRISFGANLGIKQFGIDQSRIRLSEGIEDAPNVPLNNMNKTLPDMALGFWIYHKLFYFGASTQQLFMNSLGAPSIYDRVNNDANVVNRLAQHYYITGGGLIWMGQFTALIPSVLVKKVFVAPSVSVDINAKVRYSFNTKVKNKDMIWGGISYRNQDAVVFLAGFLYDNKYEFGYAYDYSVLSGLRAHSAGSHEIMLGYRFMPNAQIISPSDFW